MSKPEINADTMMQAILAMDVYQRGYNYGVRWEPDYRGKWSDLPRQIGPWSVGFDSSAVTVNEGDEAIGFFAQIYRNGNQTVISYRGTDDSFAQPRHPLLGGGTDAANGFGMGGGIPDVAQGLAALEFYREVISGGVAKADISITGQSLGGGLAGFVAAFYGLPAIVFDNMPFEAAVRYAESLLDRDFSLLGLSQQPAILGSLALGIGLASIPTEWFKGTSTAELEQRALALENVLAGNSAIDFSRVGGMALDWEMLQPLRALMAPFSPDRVPETSISPWGISLPSGLPDVAKRHSQSTLVITLYGYLPQEEGGAGSTGWQPFMSNVWESLYRSEVGSAIGLSERVFDEVSFQSEGLRQYWGPHDQMQVMIAYSAIQHGATIFGNTALAALYSDTEDLAKIYSVGVPSVLGGLAAPLVRRGFADIIAQFSGDLAFQKNSDSDARAGAFTWDGLSLRANLDPELWKATFNKGQQAELALGQKKIVGIEHLVSAVKLELTLESLLVPDINRAIDKAFHEWTETQTDSTKITRIETAGRDAVVNLSASDAPNAFDGTKGGAILVGSFGDDTLAGAPGDDLLIGGKGNDTFRWTTGKDLLFGGEGDDLFVVDPGGIERMPTDQVIFFGGAGTNRADYGNVTGQGVKIENKAIVGGQQVKGIDKNDPVWTVTYKTSGSQDILIDVLRPTGSGFEDELDLRAFFQKASETVFGGLLQLLDFGGQKASAGQHGGGDLVDGSALDAPGGEGQDAGTGQVYDFADPARQFVADYTDPLPGDLGSLTGFPGDTFAAVAKLEQLIRIAEAPDPLVASYARDTRLDLANAESITATRFDDIIIGADKVFDWVTPPADPNAAPDAPPPAPEWKLDPNFGGYVIDAGDGDDVVMIRDGSREQKLFDRIDGGAGDDVIFARGSLGGEIFGGDGNDFIAAGRGQGVDVYGGAGDDFLLNYSKGRIYGDSVDTAPGTGGKDKFFWAPGAFIMDAEQHDRLYFMGIPLTGGSNLYSGLYLIGDGQVRDWIFPFVTYGAAPAAGGKVQLLVGYGNITPAMSEQELLARAMVVENYDFAGGGAEFGFSQRANVGDLGMRFMLFNAADPNSSQVQQNLLVALAGFIGEWAGAALRFAKAVRWASLDDPLALDLDGDGIETTQASDRLANDNAWQAAA